MTAPLTANERRVLRDELNYAMRQREQVAAAIRYLARRVAEMPTSRSFYVCKAIAFTVADIDHRCSKRAEAGSPYCRFHWDRSASDALETEEKQ